MNKILIRFNRSEGIISIVPLGVGTEVLSMNKLIIATPEESKLMLVALGIETQKLDDYINNNKIED